MTDDLTYLTVKDAAALACVSIPTIRYHIDRGNLLYRFEAHRYWIGLASLERLYRLSEGGLTSTEKRIYDLG